ncbi:MAG: DNA repair protein RecO [Phycisphaeraceae bacterium]|nr:MAG: DNA repair protein RecO [Phycisphaeraceae bacterium]
MPSITDEALCIRVWDWSETSQTVSLFTRTHGVLRGLAKGSKRPTSKFSGGIELLTLGEVVAIVKPSSELATLTDWNLTALYPGLRNNLQAFHAAMYAADLVGHALRDADPHPAWFDAARDTLAALRPGAVLAPLAAFQWTSLVEAGYKPELNTDIVTGEPLAKAGSYYFLPRSGGLCVAPTDPAAPAWRIRAETLDSLREYERTKSFQETNNNLSRVNRFLASYWREILGLEIPTFRVMFGSDSHAGSGSR